LRGIAEALADVSCRIDELHAGIVQALKDRRFGTPREKVPVGDYHIAEHLDDLRKKLDGLGEALGRDYDDLAPYCGLPTREQA
jgi:hypothetical protein